MAPHNYQGAVRDKGFHGFPFYANHVFVFTQGPFHVNGRRDSVAFRKRACGDVADYLRTVFTPGVSSMGRKLSDQGNQGGVCWPQLAFLRRFVRQIRQPLAEGDAFFRGGPFIFPHALFRDFQHEAIGLDRFVFRLNRFVLRHQGLDFQHGAGGEGAGGGEPVIHRTFFRTAFHGKPVTVFPNGLQPVFHIPFCRCHGLMIHDFRELSIERNKLNSLKYVDALTKIVKKAL